ncbi:MAG: polysaccharide export protein [Deltaproteobacteria bacterium]|nr:polysaccharide export protein [Deltaproteobacteria bacterium]
MNPGLFANISTTAMRLVLLISVLLMACGDNPPVVYPTVAPFDETQLALGAGDKLELTIFRCAVLGQVVKSGSVKFTPGMTITEAIAQSGGFTPLARKNMVRVTRLVEGKKATYKIPVEMIAEGKRPNFPMAPGDEVFVPERAW